jgi:hypothetical protein
MENEQLYNSLKCMKDTNKKVKSIYDGRLDDKDKIINNLQDRIQNFFQFFYFNIMMSFKISLNVTINQLRFF